MWLHPPLIAPPPPNMADKKKKKKNTPFKLHGWGQHTPAQSCSGSVFPWWGGGCQLFSGCFCHLSPLPPAGGGSHRGGALHGALRFRKVPARLEWPTGDMRNGHKRAETVPDFIRTPCVGFSVYFLVALGITVYQTSDGKCYMLVLLSRKVWVLPL